MRKAYIIECPKCHAHRINRKKKKCQVCGQVLLYRGDYFGPDDDAFHWMGEGRGWVHVSKLVKSSNVRTLRQPPGETQIGTENL